MAAGMSRREPLFDPEAVFTLPATPSSQQIPLFAEKERGQGDFCTARLYRMENGFEKLQSGPAKGCTVAKR